MSAKFACTVVGCPCNYWHGVNPHTERGYYCGKCLHSFGDVEGFELLPPNPPGGADCGEPTIPAQSPRYHRWKYDDIVKDMEQRIIALEHLVHELRRSQP